MKIQRLLLPEGSAQLQRLESTIRDGKLYRREFDTFQDYGQSKWGWNSNYARGLIPASDVSKAVPIGTIVSESQARELAKVEPAERLEVLEKAGSVPTAKAIRQTAEEIEQPRIKIADDEISEAETQSGGMPPELKTKPEAATNATVVDVESCVLRAWTWRKSENWYYGTSKEKRRRFINHLVSTGKDVLVKNKVKLKARLDLWFEQPVMEKKETTS